MPNVKLFIDEAHYQSLHSGLVALLAPLRDMLCAALSVDHAACHIAVIPVIGLPDQPQINAELSYLPRPERTPTLLRQVAQEVRSQLHSATGLPVAVRIAALDPASYIALK
ncbi:hypothetical protein EEB11_12635 [Pseudotabrizicola sediminis]|uniref:Uncharacterized protein n=1 Tax=Pseudotabrizicola sediminis TaxID=2486418 RepID=A0ABY2KNN2_9RHOB|nr:hypothetical protein [Pseudotabrizicola sediminis]TGD42596.1 hypothetical protein EEB11_12635 [Pseudotabrizicola sediminis]